MRVYQTLELQQEKEDITSTADNKETAKPKIQETNVKVTKGFYQRNRRYKIEESTAYTRHLMCHGRLLHITQTSQAY